MPSACGRAERPLGSMHIPTMRRREAARDSSPSSCLTPDCALDWPHRSNLFSDLSSNLFSNIDVHLGSFATGSGLLLLVELCGTTLPPGEAAAALALGAVAGWIFSWLQGGGGRAPVWLCLSSGTVNVVFTLAALLSVFARLCPLEGKELVLIPVYFQLCMSRLQVYLTWPTPVLGCLFLVLLLGVADPYGSDSGPQFLPDGYVPVSSPSSFAALAVLAAYDALSQWCRLSERVFHFPPEGMWQLRLHTDAACLAEVSAWALVRLLAFGTLALARGVWDAGLMRLLLSPLPTYSSPRSFSWLAVFYADVLLLSCMCMSGAWFQCLRGAAEAVSRQPLPAQRLVRLQHILNAFVVCAAWAFPLESAELSTGLRAGAAGAALIAAAAWAGQKNGAR